ncbi:benenodin family lasso peptide [Rhodanobacter denitrificans]|nr:benenodin family lasso peptide [Rhodanobacter denitrificans]UJM90173.1 benenodin family lasso peptide [Rhodanobacter denitrificans]
MNTNENIRNDTPEDVIVLGVASVETKGPMGSTEPEGGLGRPVIPGISEE